MLTVSDKSEYCNYHIDKKYLEGIKLDLKEIVYINARDKNISIPLIKKNVIDNYYDLFSPVGFQASLGCDFWKNNLKKLKDILFRNNVISFYLLVKDELNINEENSDTKLYRTNYYFNLTQTIEVLLNNQKRDCKQRLKKVMKDINYKLTFDSNLQDFEKHYRKISKKNNFSETYIFGLEDLTKIFKANGITYLELVDNKDRFLAGGFFGTYDSDVDYLYGANSIIYDDTIRLLIWEAVKYFKKTGYKSLYLGGGINENDSLSKYKKRFGTIEKKCSVIRSIINIDVAEKLMNEKIDNSWFDNFFPPYRKASSDE